MWKYVTCCLRETLQRSVNYFDARCGVGLASNQSSSIIPRKDSTLSVPAAEGKHGCSGNCDERDTRRNDGNWYEEHITRPWVNAFTWSGAIILGWYSSQLMCITQKRRGWVQSHGEKKHYLCNFLLSNTKAIHSSVLSNYVFAQPLLPPKHYPRRETVNSSFHKNEFKSNVPYNVTNERDLTHNDIASEDKLDAAAKDLTDVLSSVENKLGLAAVQMGNAQEGLAMLHSAAQRNHAPALYNLGICYERGLGIKKDDKMAAELYRTAASLGHASAMYNLAIFHGQGRGGLARDSLAAEKLLRLAASKGQEEAVRALGRSHPLDVPEAKLRNSLKEETSNVKKFAQSYNRNKNERFDSNISSPTEVFLNLIAGNVAKEQQHKESLNISLY